MNTTDNLRNEITALHATEQFADGISSAWDKQERLKIASAPQPEQPAVQGEPVAQWQKKHPLRTEGVWENTNEHDAKWWRDNSQGWEIRALYARPQPSENPSTPEHEALTDEQAVKALQMAIDDVRAIGLQVEAAAHIVGYFCNRVNSIKGAQQ